MMHITEWECLKMIRSIRDIPLSEGLYTEACQIVVRADSDIRSVEDLQGKTVSVGEEESGTE